MISRVVRMAPYGAGRSENRRDFPPAARPSSDSYAARFTFAHRARWAASIFVRADAGMVLFGFANLKNSAG
jgi:hypothetical protein